MSKSHKNRPIASSSSKLISHHKALSGNNIIKSTPIESLFLSRTERSPLDNQKFSSTTKSVETQTNCQFTTFDDPLTANTSLWNIETSLKNVLPEQNLDEIPQNLKSVTETAYDSSIKDSFTKISDQSSIRNSLKHEKYLNNILISKLTQGPCTNRVVDEGTLLCRHEIQPELNKNYFTALENRLVKIERRLETNETLIHLHEDMSKLKLQEAKTTILQDENLINSIQTRLACLENNVKLIEDSMKSYKLDFELKIDEFSKKVENYLQKFTQTTQVLATKIDALSSSNEYDTTISNTNSTTNIKLTSIENRLNIICDDFKEKLKRVHNTIEENSKVSIQSLSLLTEEKKNITRLEDDFIKVLSALNAYNNNKCEFNWLADEIAFLKNKQIQIINYLNLSLLGGGGGATATTTTGGGAGHLKPQQTHLEANSFNKMNLHYG